MTHDLAWVPAAEHPELLAEPVAQVIGEVSGAQAAPIDPELADTAAFCEHYGVPLNESANCVVVAAKRGGEVTYAACLVLATNRADINGVVRKELGARKVSFAPMDQATSLTGMEYGGITPVGLPQDWVLLVDEAIPALPAVIVGSGLRRSKLQLPGKSLTTLPQARVLPLSLP